MSPLAIRAVDALSRFPRVSGDEPPSMALVIELVMFSPRERG